VISSIDPAFARIAISVAGMNDCGDGFLHPALAKLKMVTGTILVVAAYFERDRYRRNPSAARLFDEDAVRR
jgi:hypothetical protein